MDDEASIRCGVEGCTEQALERGPGVYFCDHHWEDLCDAWARQRLGVPLTGASARHDPASSESREADGTVVLRR
jgi:hypothetical protein